MSSKKIKYYVIIASITGISIATAAFFQFSGTSWTAHILGSFFSDGTGNAGNVIFNQVAGLNGNKLVWTFWVETVGTVTFDASAEVHAPASGKVTDLWSVSGFASSNAGPIDLSGVQYDPVTKTLIWFGTNNWIWKVPFGIAGSIATSISGSTISTGFEWRVKVLGNIGWTSSFDTFYNPGVKFNASVMSSSLNKIRENVAILTRNITNTYTNSSFGTSAPTRLGNKILFINNGGTNKTLRYTDIDSDFPSVSVDSIIVIGGDIIIDSDIINTTPKPKGIIVLKNAAGLGGNIVITNNVKKIESSIFTEGTVYSGDDMANLYNDTTLKVTTLGENQLYIKGSLISRNTIGWAIQDGAIAGNGVCVYNQTSCTYEQAVKYDLNYFRLTPPTRTAATRSYNADYDNYAVIIERDSRISSNPPPGFETK